MIVYEEPYDPLSEYFSPKQLESIRNSDAPINIWEGAVSAGKTYSSLWRFYDEASKGPPGEFCILTKTYDTFKRNLLPILNNILGPHADYLSGKREIYLKNRLVHVIGCSDERAEHKIRGPTFAGAYVDEITLIPETAFRMLQSRLRVPNAKLFGTTNPDSPYHWFKKDFLNGTNPDVKSWQFLMEDNPFLTADYKDMLKRQYRGLWYKRFIEGKWVQAEGAIYDFFDEAFHVIEVAPTATYYVVGIDYGTTNPCAFVMLGYNKSRSPNIWVEDEYYYNSRVQQRQKTDAEYVDDLIKFIRGKNVQGIYLDPSAASFRAALIQAGVDQVMDAENDVDNGIIYTMRKLSNGSLKICKKCSNLIAEFQSYVWDDKAIQKGIDKPKKENDHALDALRYVMYSHFAPREDGESNARDLDKRWRDAMGLKDDLPRFFQDPKEGFYGF